MIMQNQILKKAYVFLSAVFILIIHLPLVSANTRPLQTAKPVLANYTAHLSNNTLPETAKEDLITRANTLYETMQLHEAGLSKQTFDYAIKGFDQLLQSGKFVNEHIISIVDLSMPSTKKRLFIIDLNEAKVLFNTYVAHGVNSGKVMASNFSNALQSYKSSLGFYQTLGTYMGGHGYSLRLEGLEKGINDNANRRDIVIHGAPYVNESLIRSQGYIGRSWGCPALPENLNKPIINTIKNGTCLFIYGNNKSYVKRSKIING